MVYFNRNICCLFGLLFDAVPMAEAAVVFVVLPPTCPACNPAHSRGATVVLW